MNTVKVAGLAVTQGTKTEILATIQQRLQSGTQTFVATPYSEFLYHSLINPDVMTILNSADIIVPDGIGILWADKFLRAPFTVEGFHKKIFQGFWQILYTGLGILTSPKSVRKTFPETISGADLFWDINHLAEKNNYSIYLLGGFGDTPKIVAEKLTEQFPRLSIAGISNKRLDDESIIYDVKTAKPDILFVALGPIEQEKWIAKNIHQLPIKLAIGLGGTFDYVAGKVPHPPRWMRTIGLEWLYRLATQPKRIKRIWNAVYGLCQVLLRYKVFTSQPYRQNVVTVAINKTGQVLVCKRNNIQPNLKFFGRKQDEKDFENYWQFPQGGIDPGESREEAATRELMEETNITSAKLMEFSTAKHCYDWNNGNRRLWGNVSCLRGQEQHIAYFLYNNDGDIKVDNQEFTDYKWVSIGELLNVLHPERHPVAKIVKQDFPALVKNGNVHLP